MEAMSRKNGGDPNLKYGWYADSMEEIEGIISHGFSSREDDDGSHGIGILLVSSKCSLFSASKPFTFFHSDSSVSRPSTLPNSKQKTSFGKRDSKQRQRRRKRPNERLQVFLHMIEAVISSVLPHSQCQLQH